ncbi:MAG: YheC/YheD family protein [Parcubacteria group bacterium]|jgi:glutathione synthase/RimK-type ligase-like ATP-grasp enzyme
MANKKMMVIYTSNDWHKKIPIASDTTRESFEDWHERGLLNGVEMYRASIDWYDGKTNAFKKSWAFRNKKWIKIKTPITPDLVFDKISGKYDYALFDFKMLLSQKTKIFNHPLFRTLLDNKLSQYLIFGEFMPRSFLATNKKEMTEALAKISSSKVVIKPLYGSGGFGIIIDEKNKIPKNKIVFPALIQEFIKSEKGIPHFSKKDEVADLRLIFINHKLVYALSRIAKRGSLFTNFHQGASAVFVPRKNIPPSIQKIVKKIVKKLSLYPEANYSLDFIFTNTGKPLLVEMNTTPGFDLLHLVGDEKTKEKHFQEFIKTIV